jgi:NAD(P)-dependent dehydrogenase (short-subunit alcohol dehydrogenase family)
MKKAALITGASSGIGLATALEFSRNGYFVYLMGRNKEALTETALQCRAGASVLSCDLKDPAAVEKRLAEVFNNKIYRLEVLVNNAGIFTRGLIEESSDALWTEQFEVNMMGPVRVTRGLWSYFKAHGGGSIVNVSSTLGLRPTQDTAVYSAVKAAMINWTSSLAQEGGPHQIRVNCVCPGIVQTPIHGFDKMPPELRDETLQQLQNLQPLGRIGAPEDIAKTIYFLGSPASSWTTGSIVSVDGGINLV